MPEALIERISQHLLERAVGPVTIGGFPAARRPSQRDPVGCPVAGAPPSGIDESFQVVNGMPVNAFPIPRRQRRHPAQNVGR